MSGCVFILNEAVPLSTNGRAVDGNSAELASIILLPDRSAAPAVSKDSFAPPAIVALGASGGSGAPAASPPEPVVGASGGSGASAGGAAAPAAALSATPLDVPGHAGAFAVTSAGALSAAEAAACVALTERVGYGAALLNAGYNAQVLATDVRSGSRCIIDSPAFADALFARIQHLLPASMHGRALVGLNERMRFLKYDGGQFFRMHQDGLFVRQEGPLRGQRSFVTLLLYLNDGKEYEGCRTTFYDPAMAYLFTEKGVPLEAGCAEGFMEVEPTTGLLLLHDHRILHAATPLIAGRKYVLRTDVMYAAAAD